MFEVCHGSTTLSGRMVIYSGVVQGPVWIEVASQSTLTRRTKLPPVGLKLVNLSLLGACRLAAFLVAYPPVSMGPSVVHVLWLLPPRGPVAAVVSPPPACFPLAPTHPFPPLTSPVFWRGSGKAASLSAFSKHICSQV